MKKIVVGMSGGVDSSVAAAILMEQACLRRQGHEVTGVYIEAYNEPGCRADEDKRDALKVATQLGISFEVLDLRKEYRESVVKYFYDEYKSGRTPNPDIVCNLEIKFGLFLDWALEQGYDKVATGHYARIVEKQGSELNRQSSEPCFLLQSAVDAGKDQSYFLWRVTPDRLEHVLFPLGEMTKVQVRAKGKELGLPNYDKPDSMGVCMMGELDVARKLREELGERGGEVVMGGEEVGKHNGLWFSTVGQRVGQEISLKGQALKAVGIDTTKMPALYVIGKNVKENQVIIGDRIEGEVNQVKLKEARWYGDYPRLWREAGSALRLRIRNLGKMILISSLEENNDEWVIRLEKDVWGVAAGQSAVVYDDEGRVVGGGEIV